jgi:DNA-binding beta-propeller fold protein YncE
MRLILLFLTFFIVSCHDIAAFAQDRVALVIGNDHYPNLPPDRQLQKAVNDARAVGNTLEKIGFKVFRGENLDRAGMVDRIFAFSQAIKPGDIAVVFFAGHGVAFSGGNFLLPADIPLPKAGEEARARNLSLGESDIIADIQERKPRVLVMILDACRDNPFRQPGLTRSIGNETGLLRGREAEGVFTIYSAGFGQTALDRLGENDRSQNSIFTRALLPALSLTDTHLADVVINVREEVARLAASVGHRQSPAYYDQTQGGRIYLAGRSITVSAPPAPLSAPAPVAPQAAPVAPPPPPAAAKPPAVAALPPAPQARTLLQRWQRKIGTAVSAAAISRDGRFVAVGNSAIDIVNAENGQTIRSFAAYHYGVCSLAFSPDGTMLASVGCGEKPVKIWDPATGRLIRNFEETPVGYSSVAFSPDGRQIAAAANKSLVIWDLSGRLVWKVADLIGGSSVAFSPDGRWIATSGGKGVALWDRTSGAPVKEFLKGHDTVVHAVAFSPDSQRLITGNAYLGITDIKSGKTTLSPFSLLKSPIYKLAVAPDGRAIVSGGPDEEVRLWDAETAQPLQIITGYTHRITALGFSADGRRVVSSDWAGLVRMFALE